MLKALEINGFKSFADRTRFEFPPGITVVVGPNGSGKSNVVDAIKWVLGEQSAKSLRGREMADVIFKGSGSGQRKPANSAEATLVFDNSRGMLDLDSAEVQVTRRVFRGGEGEYLVNGQPCRLKDIKQLFRGTGVGSDAYSLIEQGKVDSLLQASAHERRAILEEAAGISRFKAKKLEAERRLERVDQNLLRLSDIVEEVDGRLRRLKSQASKARRYKELSDRLKLLRTHVGHSDWQEFSLRLDVAQQRLDTFRTQAEALRQELAHREALGRDLSDSMAEARDELRRCESETAESRERLASLVAARSMSGTRLAEHAASQGQLRQRTQALRLRHGGLVASARELEQSRSEALETQRRSAQSLAVEVSQLEAMLHAAQVARQEIQSIERQRTDGHQAQAEAERTRARCLGAIESAEAALQAASTRQTELDATTLQSEEELAKSQESHQSLVDESSRRDATLRTATRMRNDLQQSLDAVRANLAEQHDRRIAIGERIAVLQEIESRLEGIGEGVQWFLRKAQEAPEGPFGDVRGMVADLLEVIDGAKADMIAAALADRAQHLVLTGGRLIDELQARPVAMASRVGLLRNPAVSPPVWPLQATLRGQPGVLGRADEFVQSTPEYRHLLDWLLGDTWFVESLSVALHFSHSLACPVRFVTPRGEVLERDGRLMLGPYVEGGNLISRRAELRSLRNELEQVENSHRAAQSEVDAIQGESARQTHLVHEAQEAHRQLEDQRLRAQAAVDAAQRLLSELIQRRSELAADLRDASNRRSNAREELELTNQLLYRLEQDQESLAGQIRDRHAAVTQGEHAIAMARDRVAQSQVLAATSQQTSDALTSRLDALHEEIRERDRELCMAVDEGRSNQERSLQGELALLQTGSEIAIWTLRLEEVARRQRAASARTDDHTRQSANHMQACQRLREELTETERECHVLDLEVQRAQHERQTLAERLQEDYGIDIAAEMSPSNPEAAAERGEVNSEIVDLRRKLAQLGAVNMDALAELNELEARYETLASQYRDLMEAKASLEKIIQRINTDSRRLYADTLDAVRVNFQALFRKVFGGGRADIIIEEDKDLLESGIEIVATPPGKHSLNLSLLSGGERALTAVTLLLALFQYRPSPFCVLDEVDGPLDEANIGRFVGVLKEFLNWTSFIIVTHSKKTMTAADTLYGVTMQESGVSKRVSVRFEDVNDKGEIVARATNDQESGNERGAA